MRERIKNNRAFSLGTNFIADISWEASFGYKKKMADVKIALEPFRIGDEAGARRNKKF